MDTEGGAPSNQQISDEELLEAVDTACDRIGTPVVKAENVAKVEGVPIGQRRVYQRLDRLEEDERVNKFPIGRYGVWWTPGEGEEARGEIDPDSIYWGGVDPDDIPSHLIEQRPECQAPTRWENIRRAGSNLMTTALVGFVVGIAITLTEFYGVSFLQFPSVVDAIGAIAFLGGAMFILLGILVDFVGRLGQRGHERGIWQGLRDRVVGRAASVVNSSRLPVTWDE